MRCPDCIKNKLGIFFFVFLLFVCPFLLYILITELNFEYGKWVVIILWWFLLLIIYHYRMKVSEKNHIITELNEKFKLDAKLKNMQENENSSLYCYKLLSGIKDAIINNKK